MLELLTALMISFNVQYTVIDDNSIQISSKDMITLQSSEEFQRLEPEASESIIVSDEVDPNSVSSDRE